MPLLTVAGQRQVRPPGEVVLMVVVFLDHAKVVLPRQLQQLLPAPGRQADRGRELVMGSDVQHAHLVQPAKCIDLLDPAALVIQVHGDQPGAQLAEDLPRRRIAQALDQHNVTGFEQHAGHQVQRHLHALGQADMLGANVQAAIVPQHVGQGAAQGVAAARTAMAHGVGGKAVAQGVTVITVQNGLRQQAVVTGAVVEEQRTRPILLRGSLFVGREVGNGRLLL
ncbi:hypothetical protein D3C79_512950 [compost metagenome]